METENLDIKEKEQFEKEDESPKPEETTNAVTTKSSDTKNNIEQYLDETIYTYLGNETDVPEHDTEIEDNYEVTFEELRARMEEERFQKQSVEELIDDILDSVEQTRLFKEKYEQIERDHDQYPLFDLKDYLPDFKIDLDTIRKLSFRETLVVSYVDEVGEEGGEVPKAVGAMCLNVQFGKGMPTPTPMTDAQLERDIEQTVERVKRESRTQWKNRHQKINKIEILEQNLKNYEDFLDCQIEDKVDKFVVHLSSDFNVNGSNAGSRILSWVDRKLHTLEERRTEYIQDTNQSECKKSKQILYFALQPESYYVKHVEKNVKEEAPKETRAYYPKLNCQHLVGEGANFVLMRYLAITKFVGSFELSTIYIDGSMCRNLYECTEPYQGKVNNQTAELMKIYRSIIEENGIQHQCVTVMSTYGKIISQEWDGCPYIFHVNPLSVSVAKPMFHDTLSLKKLWENDMELMSKYLDCKTEAELKMKTYLKDYPELQALMADYVQSILLLKPENILPFTQDFFLGFEPYTLPNLPYFEDTEKQEENNHMLW